MRVLGIDVGLSGACTVFGRRTLESTPTILSCLDMPTTGEGGGRRVDCRRLRDWLREWKPDCAYIENASLMPSIPDKFGNRRAMGGATGGRYMRAAGQIEATVDCQDIPIVLIMPAVWKRALNLIGTNKRASLEMARDLFPNVDWFALMKHEHRAESCLLSVYGASRRGLIRLAPADAPAAQNAPTGLPF